MVFGDFYFFTVEKSPQIVVLRTSLGLQGRLVSGDLSSIVKEGDEQILYLDNVSAIWIDKNHLQKAQRTDIRLSALDVSSVYYLNGEVISLSNLIEMLKGKAQFEKEDVH